ncbi:hypothetical protein D3C81_1551860 [compost metagenome]
MHAHHSGDLLENDGQRQAEGESAQNRFGDEGRDTAQTKHPGQQKQRTGDEHQTGRQSGAQLRITIGQCRRRRRQHSRRRRRRRDNRKATRTEHPVAEQPSKQRDYPGLWRQRGNGRIRHRFGQQETGYR